MPSLSDGGSHIQRREKVSAGYYPEVWAKRFEPYLEVNAFGG